MPLTFHRITDGATRRQDSYGSGQFGVRRGEGQRTHQGLAIIVRPGQAVRSPIDGEVTREAFPYANDRRYTGIVIRGEGNWKGIEVKMFYIRGLFTGATSAGDIVGNAQDLTIKYPGITNHVHLEVRDNGTLISPLETYRMCF